MEFDRMKAQNRADVTETLLRGLESEGARLNSRLKLLQGEIEGARKVIEAKERQILEAERQAEALRQKLDYVRGQATELADDHAHWRRAV
jgi:chromosome segregation ATPase